MKVKLKSIANEYARQVGELIDYKPQYWVGEDMCIDVCFYNDVYFLNLADMQIIIDHLDDWIKKYGSKERVGESVTAWMDCCIVGSVDDFGNYRSNPRINLWSWLLGLRPNQLKPSIYNESHQIEFQLNVLKSVIKTYPTHSIGNIIQQLEARLKEMNKQIAAEAEASIKDSTAYQDFINTLNETNEQPY